MEEKDVTKTELKKVAKELNDQLGLEPPILLDLKASALKVKVVEAATLIDPKEDAFSDAAWEILEALGACARPESEEVEDDTNADDVEEDEDEDEDEPEEEEADEDAEATEDVEGAAADVAVEEALVSTLASDFKEAKKLIDLKKLVQEWDIFSEIDIAAPCYAGLSGPRKLRADMLECMPEEVRNQIEPKPVAKIEKAPGAEGTKRGPVGGKPKWQHMCEIIVENPKITVDEAIVKMTERGASMSRNVVSIYIREIGYTLSLVK